MFISCDLPPPNLFLSVTYTQTGAESEGKKRGREGRKEGEKGRGREGIKSLRIVLSSAELSPLRHLCRNLWYCCCWKPLALRRVWEGCWKVGMEWAAGELEWRSGLLTRLPGGAHERENGKDRTEVHSGARGGFSPPLEFNTTVCHISGMHLIAAECNANFSGAELCATRKGMVTFACMVLCMACKLLKINALRKVTKP